MASPEPCLMGRPLRTLALAAALLLLAGSPGFAQSSSNAFGVAEASASIVSQSAFNSMREAGISIVRYDVYWNFVNPAQGVFDWRTPDTNIARMRAAGLEVFARIVFAPAWATGVTYPNDLVPFYCLVNNHPDCFDPNKTPNSQAFQDFVRAFVTRYRDNLVGMGYGYEVHNNVFYTGGPDKFVREILVPGYQVTKSIAPSLPVIGPDEDIAGTLDYLLQLEGVYGRWCDIITYHILRHSGGSVARLDNELKPVIDRRGGGRAVWLTEVGMEATNDALAEEVQAAWLVDTLRGIIQRSWITKSFVYELKNGGPTSGFGLLRLDETRRPSWRALRDFIASLGGSLPPPPPPPTTHTLTMTGTGSGTVSSSPGGIMCGSDCTEAYGEGTVVTFAPTAAAGWMFVGWTGDDDCADGAVTMSSARNCTARFVAVGRSTLDFNSDATGDVFAHTPETGLWSLELGAPPIPNTFTRAPGMWSPGWTVIAAEFNRDGRTDLFLHNPLTGVWFKAFSNGIGGFTYFSGMWSPGWTTIVLDMNGDGVSDIFLYNAATGLWFKCISNGDGEFIYHGGAWSGGWRLYPADWNGDGRADLLLHNPITGQWFRATTDGGAGFSYYTESWSPMWDIYLGDFNGDGLTDVFLFNPLSGQWFVCTNNGTSFSYATGFWAPGWSIDVGDMNGDGRADVFLYNINTGQWFQALYNGVNEFQYYTSAWSGGWNVVLLDFNFDNRMDVLLYNPVTGQWFQCLNLGPGAFSYSTGSWSPGLTLVASLVRTP